MVGLLDIGPAFEEVEVRGTKLQVVGLTAEGLFHLFAQFPAVAKSVSDRGDLSAEEMMQLAPDAVAFAIAAVTGAPGNKEAIAIAKSLSAQEQLDILEAGIRLTFPRGAGPFVQTLMRLIESADVGDASGWDRVTKSLAQSKSLSRSATRQPKSGDTPQGDLQASSS
jgi:hypothetical protein